MRQNDKRDFYYTLNEDHTGTYYFLSEVDAFTAPGFLVCAYNFPMDQALSPRYFTITEKRTEALSTHSANEPDHITLKPLTNKQQYLNAVSKLKQHIQRGDIYEINYCIKFQSDRAIDLDVRNTFIRLKEIAKAPYSGLLKIGNNYILCASPELFLSKKGDTLYTKPIKGTRKRGADKQQDQMLKSELFNSLKERTENVMAVDVARNDLSIVAQKGSVAVNGLYTIVTYENVHQMVSTVSCRLKENLSFDTILSATFPMASMTGAPKIRAMQLIKEYENFERGFYSGTMGLVDENGDYDLPVIIRSIIYNAQEKSVSISVGSAITYLSDAEQEYEECLLKARNMLRALNAEIKT